MSQYALGLSLPPVYSADNFLVSGCNHGAWQWINAYPDWPAHAMLLYGPPGSGKTHLGHVWAARTSAHIIAADKLDGSEPPAGNLLVEDIENTRDERHLFHLYNYTKENGAHLLLTAAHPAAQLPFKLPDLTSRLLALPTAAIAQPDDDMLAGAMRKQFADRQIKVDDEVISYVVPRIERSLGKVKELVETLDAQAFQERKSITVPFVKRVLGELQNTELL